MDGLTRRIDLLNWEIQTDSKTFLLFLPESEYHELALLYLHYLLRKKGHKVIYLGQNVPLVNLKNVFTIHEVDYLVTSFTSHLSEETIALMIEELGHLYGDKKVLIGGNFLSETPIILPANFISFHSLQDFIDFLNKL